METLPYYYGDSMRGVFVPGDRLVLEKVPFTDLVPGDIISVDCCGERGYVHRIISVSDRYAVTQGDNNRMPDTAEITPESSFALVRAAVKADGTKKPVTGGPVGMKEFHRHQKSLARRFFLLNLWNKADRFAFWRLPLKAVSFSSETHYYHRNTLAARVDAAGGVHWKRRWYRLFFKLPAR